MSKASVNLDSPEVKASVATALVAGVHQRVIAESLGVSQPTISRMKDKGELKPYIEQAQLALLDSLPDAIGNIKHAIDSYQKPGEKVKIRDKDGNEKEKIIIDEQLRDHGFRASLKVAESVGILPTNLQSQTIVNILNQTENVINPIVVEYLKSRPGLLNMPPLDLDEQEESKSISLSDSN